MPQRPFRQNDITKAIKGMQAAGIRVHSVIIEADGRIIVSTDKADVSVVRKPSSWDRVLDQPL
ncbi:hypothetical protein ASE78_05815 [Sphingomonas sp. Leaf25]|nr:hypothetical protein ASE78_05815 [Sphingomonas sp. Leaf25]